MFYYRSRGPLGGSAVLIRGLTMGITGVTIWLIGGIDVLTKSP